MTEEEIVPAPQGEENPGTQDGVGERVLKGMGSDGVRRMEGEFGDLEEVVASGDAVVEDSGPQDVG